MKAQIIVIAALCGVLLLPSCNGCSRKANKLPGTEITTAGETVRIQDSLNLVYDKGEVVTDFYAGQIPGADVPGIDYDLSLIHYGMVDNGVYKLLSTYIDGDGAGRNATFVSYGRYNTYLGTKEDPAERYIRMVPFDKSDEEMYFVFEKSGALTMLDRRQKRIKSEHNYTLTRQYRD